MFLAYHRIADGKSSYLYSVTGEQLDSHLSVVARLQSAVAGMERAPLVTFDDGHDSNYKHGLALFGKHGVRATFFVIAGWMSSEDGYMTWPELKEFASLGHEIQSHGWSHRVLTDCSEADLRMEVERSKTTLEDRLAVPVEAISIPHGRWNDRVLGACAAAGYRRVYISDPWLSPQNREGVELRGRYMVRNSLRARELERLLQGDRAFLFRLRFQYRIKEIMRGFVGDAAYRRLWSVLAASQERN